MSSFSSSQDSSTTDSCPNEANKLYYYVVTDYFNYRKEVTFEPLKIFKDRAAAIAFAVQLTSKQPSGPIGKYVSNVRLIKPLPLCALFTRIFY